MALNYEKKTTNKITQKGVTKIQVEKHITKFNLKFDIMKLWLILF